MMKRFTGGVPGVAFIALLTMGCGPNPPVEQAATNPWADARQRGIEFRAIGQEPGWLLEIDEGVSMRLLYDYAERSATTAAPPPVVANGRRTYTAATATDNLTVVVEDRPCQDVMSGDPFPATVTVTINGRELMGCGRAP